MKPLAAQTASLEPGERVPDLGWLGPDGERVALHQAVHAGRFTVLLVNRDLAAPAAAAELAKFVELYGRFEGLGVQLFAISPASPAENGAQAETLGLPFPVLSDAKAATLRGLGLRAGPERNKVRGWCTLVVDPNQRIARRFDAPGGPRDAILALSYCEKRLAAWTPTVVTTQPPVLLVPDVLAPEHCARLVRAWETGDRYEGGVASRDYGRNVPVSRVKVRGDVALADLGAEAQELFALFRRRLFPEIRKAFNFRVTRAETLRIGCYDAAQAGYFAPHRDDVTPYTAHRRFAMSLNLNAGDYEGGYLRFPEYGAQLYGPETGGAIVFSCSLLHEATSVTAGRRFVLLGFFYGEAEQALREKINAQLRASGAPGP